METQTLQVITSAVAPIVMVSAAGLLSMGVQAKNLHLADRVRALMAEYRTLTQESAHHTRRDQIVEQLALFRRRIALSQRALEFVYLAMVIFVMTSLLLAATPWIGGNAPPALTGGVFFVGVLLVLIALVLEFWEMHLGLRTVDIEIGGAMKGQ
ncbi:MAG TPA: DUF2721 domain-containing protein [Candidatus Methylomirabilis sp.]|nr:DUF2721 domain-containing protein [Candidatus Methylomirabilis sp.]